MNITDTNLDILIPQLEQRRKELGLTYQNIADACEVSQSTIIRVFKQEGDPSFGTLQKVIAVLGVEYAQAPVAPEHPSQEEYIQYLKDCIDFERDERRIRLDQQEARHNQDKQERKRKNNINVALNVLYSLAFVALFVYDFMHPDRGWITAQAAGLIGAKATNILLAVRDWLQAMI